MVLGFLVQKYGQTCEAVARNLGWKTDRTNVCRLMLKCITGQEIFLLHLNNSCQRHSEKNHSGWWTDSNTHAWNPQQNPASFTAKQFSSFSKIIHIWGRRLATHDTQCQGYGQFLSPIQPRLTKEVPDILRETCKLYLCLAPLRWGV